MAGRWLFVSTFVFLSVLALSAPPSPEAETLIRFKSFLTNSNALNNWNESIAICGGDRWYWTGLICRKEKFYGLRLENMSLEGIIDIDTLTGLSGLRSLSLNNNSFKGPIPDVKRLGALKALFLSNNKFSGEISDDGFKGMDSLRKLYLNGNEFSGKIPSSLAGLSLLMELGLEENEFEGGIPDFDQRDWKYLNLSNNHLEGPIPSGLKNSTLLSFLGNDGLCGEPLSPCKPKPSKKWPYILIGIFSGTAAIILLLLLLRFLLRSSKSNAAVFDASKLKNLNFLSPTNFFKKETYQFSSTEYSYESHKRNDQNGMSLIFVRNDRPKFDFQELLSASAEVLGSGSFGSTYKAVISSGSEVVVKRFRQMKKVGKEEFYSHMRKLGRLSHPNLLPLIAFYCGKDDKLLVSDFVANGSLASHLHARKAPGSTGLDWKTRLKIIKGVARGLSHLHKELPHLSLPHGHIKSSNVLLDHNHNPILTDYALSPIVDTEHAHHHMTAFKSPEFTYHDRTSKNTDVWSLGILILEVLTGKFPANYLRQGKGANADLAAWVDAVVREEWTAEVFDEDIMMGIRYGDGEMLKLLKIGMCCCEWEVEKRWGLKQALDKIEELNEKDNDDIDDEYYSSYGSEGDFQSYKGRSRMEDESSFLSK